jgi:hypothetical protein
MIARVDITQVHYCLATTLANAKCWNQVHVRIIVTPRSVRRVFFSANIFQYFQIRAYDGRFEYDANQSTVFQHWYAFTDKVLHL